MGFSIVGLFIAASIYIPNLLFIIFKPQNVPKGLKDAGILYTVLERIGQVGVLILLIISKDNYQDVNIDTLFILMILCIVSYIFLWIRYVIKGRDFLLLFKPLVFIPIPMALFPVFAFGFASVWGTSISLGLFVVLFAIGHIVNSWHTYKFLQVKIDKSS